MPPSRGFWPTRHLVHTLSRRPFQFAAPTGVRTLSSASPLGRQHAVRTRPFLPSSASPVTGYLLANGRPSLSLWPFSGGASSATPASEPLPNTTAAAAAPSTSTSSDAVQPAASSVPDAAAAASAHAQSSLQEAASIVLPAETPQAALDKARDTADLNPALLDNIAHVGQLKELGLDYGWGPTSVVEWVVEHIHVYAGTPWYGTIILSAIAMRLLMIYPFYRMSNQQAKLQKIQPQMSVHMAEYQAAQVQGDKMAAAIASRQIGILRKQNGIVMSWLFAPIVVQAFFGFGAYKLTRAMATLPVPGFETGGWGWLADLTQADPYFIAPVALGLTMHLMARYAALDTPPSADPNVAKMAKPLSLYVFPTLMFLVTFWQSAALQISFLTATVFGTLQNLLFKNARFRELMGMEPLRQQQQQPLNGSSSAPAAAVQSQQGLTNTAQIAGQGATPKPNPFRDNPFANLNTTHPLKTSGSSFERGVRYQAPTAADTLVAGLPQPSSSSMSAQNVETPKDGNFLSRELKNARAGLGTIVEGFTEKGKSMLANQNKPGDRGRNAKFLNEARRYEEKVRKREEAAKERRGR